MAAIDDVWPATEHQELPVETRLQGIHPAKTTGDKLSPFST